MMRNVVTTVSHYSFLYTPLRWESMEEIMRKGGKDEERRKFFNLWFRDIEEMMKKRGNDEEMMRKGGNFCNRWFHQRLQKFPPFLIISSPHYYSFSSFPFIILQLYDNLEIPYDDSESSLIYLPFVDIYS